MTTSLAATYPGTRNDQRSIPRLCRALIGDWTDVRDRQSREAMGLHVTIKAHGSAVIGSIHVKRSNRWLRMEVTPAWFCARGLVYERRGKELAHVATVRLCHRRKERSVLWQVVGPDQSGCLPSETVLWAHR